MLRAVIGMTKSSYEVVAGLVEADGRVDPVSAGGGEQEREAREAEGYAGAWGVRWGSWQPRNWS